MGKFVKKGLKKSSEKYTGMRTNSAIIRMICGGLIFLTGLYFRSRVELFSGLVAIIFSLVKLKNIKRVVNVAVEKRRERESLKLIVVLLIYFSIVNPLGVVALSYDLFKRDRVLNGGLDEKED